MAARPLSDPKARFGLETRDHTPFFPCKISGLWLPVVVSISQPTAQVEPSVAVAAAKRSFSPTPAFGVVDGQRDWPARGHIGSIGGGVGLPLADKRQR